MKISALTAATTPLSGAELFPIVQSGNTRRVSLNDLLRSIGNGTAAAPSLAPGADPDTGIYFPAADTIALVTVGSQRVRITALGDVGIGTLIPSFWSARLAVDGGAFALASGNRAIFWNAAGNGLASIQGVGVDVLSFQTGSSYTERMRIDASGNLGLGVTPSTWFANSRVVQFGAGGSLEGRSNLATYFSLNANMYLNTGGTPLYLTTGVASRYTQESGTHRWFTAPSGTADAAITFTQAMTLDASGNLGIGVAGPSAALHVARAAGVNCYAFFAGGGRASTLSAIYGQDSGGVAYVWNQEGKEILFGTSNSVRWQITSAGNLVAGADNTFDIGASAATRPRDLHLARNLVGAGWLRAGAASAGAASTTTIGGTTATTVGAAGAASALPANPLGYIVAHVGTTEVRIPYYNA